MFGDESHIQKLRLEKLPLTVQRHITKDNLHFLGSLDLSAYEDMQLDLLVIQLRGYILGSEQRRHVEASVSVPATWWDALKERFLERWGWKVERRTIATTVRTWKVCPHLTTRVPDSCHYEWIAFQTPHFP